MMKSLVRMPMLLRLQHQFKQGTVLVLISAMICGVFPQSSYSIASAETISISTCQGSDAEAMKKLSSSVIAVLNGTNPSNYYDLNSNSVQVIVQTTSNKAAKIVSNEITKEGGTPIYSFRSIDGLLANIPLDKIVRIAQLCEVERITCDHTTQQTASHLETVTGLSNLRTYNSSKNTFSGVDGTGIGIAARRRRPRMHPAASMPI